MNIISHIPAEFQTTSRIFEAMGDAYRQAILLKLKAEEKLAYSEILAMFSLSRSALNHHMQVLVLSGLVSKEKKGKEIFFTLNIDVLKAAIYRVNQFIAD